MNRFLHLTLPCVALLAAALPLSADEILLRGGKTLTGRIVSETDDAYRIKLGANMYLNVDKDKVSHVTRDTPAPAATPKPAKKNQKAGTSAPAAPAKVAVSSAPAAAPSGPAGKSTRRTIGVVDLTTTVQPATYDVYGKTYDAALKTITEPEKGKGFLVRGDRQPSRTQWRISWYGKASAVGSTWQNLVVVATITPSFPAWNLKGVSSADREKWTALLKERETIEATHAEIIQDTLAAFAESATNLNAPDEKSLREQTAALITEFRARADNKRKGYDRRRMEPKKIIKKKPKR